MGGFDWIGLIPMDCMGLNGIGLDWLVSVIGLGWMAIFDLIGLGYIGLLWLSVECIVLELLYNIIYCD